ncbi:hypothetical protein I302_103031 [Kwoniella bestiolae CBS 10118]|uniref:C2H2-type domain-containing protein n=1 Tax=Kwoniella bestiolae CBS 10118 TaxID=1296100 RepID=A0A1B9GGV9_9TREE|nr:hypothetical protein I302_01727 [Kwoniella bestiolae CBS 10118]OCF30208.1 hypothetical protein I302_01727 [Kwoniella bestiolae CBS 10118]
MQGGSSSPEQSSPEISQVGIDGNGNGNNVTLQPFQCMICSRRFTRHENLKRHSLLHRPSDKNTKFSCFYCIKVFARRDLRKRHIKKQHPDQPTTPKDKDNISPPKQDDIVGTSIDMDLDIPTQIDSLSSQPTQQQPFSYDLSQLDSTIFPPSSSSSAPYQPNSNSNLSASGSYSQSLRPNETLSSNSGTIPTQEMFRIESLLTQPPLSMMEGYDQFQADHSASTYYNSTNRRPSTVTSRTSPLSSSSTADIFLSQDTVDKGVSLFFKHVSGYFPFLHRPTFSIAQTSEYLLMAILSVSMQFSEDETEGSRIAKYCFTRGRKLLDAMEQNDQELDHGAFKLDVIQSYLLLEIHALMFSAGTDSSYGLRMHNRLIELARTGGLTDPYPTQSANSGDLETLWRQYVKAESHKRTLYAAYHLDVLWYHTLSVPRTISHLEIKHDLPCSEDIWHVTTSSEWAYRTLINDQQQQSSQRYLTAVRSCLTPNQSLDMSAFDAHGSLVVILFLLSSVREMSGWSTMTGKVCIERFEALHASLTAFEPVVQSNIDSSPMSVLMQATWHTAMIELLLWSPSHTNGVVERSLEAALAASARLSNSSTTFSSPMVAASVDRHLNWFLTYLDTKMDVSDEAPWMAIFAFKAVLIAWQLVKAGCIETLNNVTPRDSSEMLDWIKDVFERRRNWKVAKIIVNSLDELEQTM